MVGLMLQPWALQKRATYFPVLTLVSCIKANTTFTTHFSGFLFEIKYLNSLAVLSLNIK